MNTTAAGSKKNRPVHLDLRTFKFPIMSFASILHRISGFVLFFIVPFLICMLQSSLSSESDFIRLKEALSAPLTKLFIWVCLCALAYHLVAGIKHLCMDIGIGETLEGGKLAAKVTLGASGVLAFILLIWIW